MFDAPQTLQELQDGLEELKHSIPQVVEGFLAHVETTGGPGALDPKTKALISIGIVAYTRCTDCIARNVQKAMDQGAGRQEILEAAAMATVFGGGPSLGVIATHVLPAIKQFEREKALGQGR